MSPLGPTPKPSHFATPGALRAWFEKHHATRTELWAGYWKKDSGRPSITWEESVDEALCFGWIDGIRRAHDGERYVIRFTPRKVTGLWSARNLRRYAELLAARRVRAAGRRAFESRRANAAHGYSIADRPDTLPAAWAKRLRADGAASAFVAAQPPGYRRAAFYWVTSAKQEATRERRFALLLAESAAGRRVLRFLRAGETG
jgi:uncharacterized protein YdeI (YjbR/CyaY-like superfamily)